MGVVTCVECGTEVNEATARCPECGADPRTGLTEEERVDARHQVPLDPVAQARTARQRGQRFLEIALPFTDREVYAMRGGRRLAAAEAAASARAQQLSDVEVEGWQLIASDYVAGGMRYQRDPLSLLEAGPLEATSLVGIYLFRAAEESSPEEAAVEEPTPRGFPD